MHIKSELWPNCNRMNLTGHPPTSSPSNRPLTSVVSVLNMNSITKRNKNGDDGCRLKTERNKNGDNGYNGYTILPHSRSSSPEKTFFCSINQNKAFSSLDVIKRINHICMVTPAVKYIPSVEEALSSDRSGTLGNNTFSWCYTHNFPQGLHHSLRDSPASPIAQWSWMPSFMVIATCLLVVAYKSDHL